MTFSEVYAKVMPEKKRKEERFNIFAHWIGRPISILMTLPLINTKVKPTTVTKYSVLASAIGFFLVAFGQNMPLKIIGWAFFLLWNLLDGVDGNLARCTDQCSALGDLWDTMAGYALQALSGMNYGKFHEANARNVPFAVYQEFKDRLPVQWARRCEHWYTEFQRVEAGAEAWRRGDLETYGRLSFESGWSSIHNWESGAPEQIRLYEIMRETDGIYGGRFAGAGFKGCCLALVRPECVDAITETVTRKYLSDFPEMTGKYGVYVCDTADGVRA